MREAVPNNTYIAIVVLKLSLEAPNAERASLRLQQDIAVLTTELRHGGCSIDDQDIVVARPIES